jgi:formate--tetrahydrofolate ligase
MVDSNLFQDNKLDLDPNKVTRPRTLDMNDRALRRIAFALGSRGNVGNRETGFVITTASEIMANFRLASSRPDLR